MSLPVPLHRYPTLATAQSLKRVLGMGGRPFTLFDAIQLFGPAGGAGAGLTVGYKSFGIAGGIAGALLGLALGAILGRLPLVLATRWIRRDLKRSTTSNLRERIKSEYYLSVWIIAELVVRGEPVESFREAVRAQLDSPNADERRFGLANAEIWFPEMAGRQPSASQTAPPSD